jgi:hypothetical protein
MGPFWSRAGLFLDFYLGKELYDEIVKRRKNVSDFVNEAVEEALEKKQRF